MIRVENVSKSFGSKKALHQISFEIKEGEILVFWALLVQVKQP